MAKKEQIDTGDKVTCSVSYKKGLKDYSSISWSAGVSLTKRDGETDEEVWQRGWKLVEDEIDNSVNEAKRLLGE